MSVSGRRLYVWSWIGGENNAQVRVVDFSTQHNHKKNVYMSEGADWTRVVYVDQRRISMTMIQFYRV